MSERNTGGAGGSPLSTDPLSRVLAASPDAVCMVLVDDGRIVFANDALLGLTGFSREELIGKTPGGAGLTAGVLIDDEIQRHLMAKRALGSVRVILRAKGGGSIETDASMQVLRLDGELAILTTARSVGAGGHGMSHRSLIESLPGVVYIEGLAGENPDIYLSPQYEDMFGRSVGSRMQDPGSWSDEIHPEDIERVMSVGAHANETLDPFSCEYRIVTPDGRIRWVHDEAVVVRDDGGLPLHWLGLVTDIQGRKNAEDRIAAAEMKFRTLVEQVPAATYIEAPEGEKEAFYISPQIEAITGYPPSAFLDPDFWASKLHPEDVERVLAEEKRCAEAGEGFNMEYRYIAADGRTIWLKEDSELVPRPDAAPLAQGIISDITEAKLAEEQIREAEEKYRNLVERVPAITYRETISGPEYPSSAHTYVSPQFEVLLGFPAGDTEDSDTFWSRVIHPDDLAGVIDESLRAVESGEAYKQEYRVVASDGRVLWVHDESVLVSTSDDGAGVWHGVIFDVTERRRAEEDARRGESALQSVAFTAERFLKSPEWREAMPEVLASLGEATGSSRSYLFEVRADEGGRLLGWETFEWCAPGVRSTIDSEENQGFPMLDSGLEWPKALAAGEPAQGLARDRPEDERAYLEREGVLSALVVPVFVGEEWWGYLGFDDCESERSWSPSEVGALRSSASLLGATIDRREVESRLREAEVTHRTLVERLPAVVYMSNPDADGELTYISPQCEGFFGYTPGERLASPKLWKEHCHPEDLPRVIERSKRSHRSGAPFSMEYRMFHRDGHLVWISDDAVIVRDDDGRALYWLGMVIDITGRKTAEEELLRHDAILEAVGYAATQFLHADVWEESIDGVLRELGQAGAVGRAYLFENRLGADDRLRSSLTHEWCAEEVEPQARNPRLQNLPATGIADPPDWAKQLSSGHPYHAIVRDLDEEQRHIFESQGIVSILLVPIFVRDDWWGFLGFDECRDERYWSAAEIEALRAASGVLGAVIQRRETESQLRSAEERHRLLVEQLPAVVYSDAIDEVSTALYISPQVEDMLGYSAEERLSTPGLWMNSLHPDDLEMVRRESDRTNATLEPFALDYRMMARDGRTVWVRDEAVVVRDEHGAPKHWQGVMFDITERKHAEEELERALKIEREATDRLRSLDEMKNTFLTAVSHDLRTPLAAVLGLALTLEREDIGLSDDESRDLAHRIASNARKLDRLVTDLLDLDRLTRGILEPNLSVTDLGLLVRKVVEEVDFLGEHPVTVEAESVSLSLDTAKVERIVENLIANSVRHTPSGTRIWVRVRAEGSGALLMVEDEGPGVLAELREAVFEPFRQGSSGQPSPGVGIGLSLVARFAELHGGRAWVAEREGGGASFRVFIPGHPQ